MSSPRPNCECHGLVMDRGGHGGFYCAERRRERQRNDWHKRRKHDPDYQLDRQLREMTRIRVRY